MNKALTTGAGIRTAGDIVRSWSSQDRAIAAGLLDERRDAMTRKWFRRVDRLATEPRALVSIEV